MPTQFIRPVLPWYQNLKKKKMKTKEQYPSWTQVKKDFEKNTNISNLNHRIKINKGIKWAILNKYVQKGRGKLENEEKKRGRH